MKQLQPQLYQMLCALCVLCLFASGLRAQAVEPPQLVLEPPRNVLANSDYAFTPTLDLSLIHI